MKKLIELIFTENEDSERATTVVLLVIAILIITALIRIILT